MRNYYAILIIGFVLLCSGCKDKSETVVTESETIATERETVATESKDVVLATYKGGTITEPDFLKWMRAKHFGERKISTILESKKRKEGHLRRVALERLTALEAEKAGYEKGEDFKRVIKFAKKDYIIKCLRKKIRDETKFKEDCVKARMIELDVKDYSLVDGVKKVKLPEAELEKKFKEKMDIAKIVIEELNRGGDFAELAKEYSDDHSKRRGGDIGYVYRGMEYPVIAEDAFLLQEGEYTKTPLRKRNGVYIIKVEDKKEITNDNIEEEITDENKARALEMRLRAKAALRFENDLAFADDAEAYFGKISSQEINTVLFRINDKPFTIEDFDKEIADLEDDGKGNVLREQLRQLESLLLREAFKRAINKEPEFVEGWEIIRRATLAAEYKNRVILSLADIKLTEEEIEMEYDKRMKGGDTKRLSRDDVEKMLKGRKRFEKKLNWEEEALTKNEFKIV